MATRWPLHAITSSAVAQALAETVPDTDGVMMVLAFTGLGAPYWNLEARGTITRITCGTTLAHIARAALESIAFQSTALLQAMRRGVVQSGGVAVTEMRVDGGPCVNNLLMQFQADLLGITVVRPAVTETTAFGAAYLAGLSTGVYRSTDELSALWRSERRFESTMAPSLATELMARWDHAVMASRSLTSEKKSAPRRYCLNSTFSTTYRQYDHCSPLMNERMAFIGGGNMASAIIGGLIQQGVSPQTIDVIEPFAEARDKLLSNFGIHAHAQAASFLSAAAIVVWAVKPQAFKEATLAVAAHTTGALHLSVAAGIRSDSIAAWLGTERVVRAMPNTPALIGKGMTGLFARAGATQADQSRVNQVIATTGDYLWLDEEEKLDAVTALSGSGPAYVFYFMEAMTTAGTEMGLTREQAHQLAVTTFIGASELARASSEPPQVLRQRVTSKGGTTYAAISAMENDDVRALFIDAMYAARERAKELGDEFGKV